MILIWFLYDEWKTFFHIDVVPFVLGQIFGIRRLPGPPHPPSRPPGLEARPFTTHPAQTCESDKVMGREQGSCKALWRSLFRKLLISPMFIWGTRLRYGRLISGKYGKYLAKSWIRGWSYVGTSMSIASKLSGSKAFFQATAGGSSLVQLPRFKICRVISPLNRVLVLARTTAMPHPEASQHAIDEVCWARKFVTA